MGDKTTRHKYFEIYFYPGFDYDKACLNFEDSIVKSFLKNNRFVSQYILENVFYDFEIKDRKRSIVFKNFEGQFQRVEETKCPYWLVSAKTSAVITRRKIENRIIEMLREKNSTKNIVKVIPNEQMLVLSESKQYSLKKSEWGPGYFNKQIMDLCKLMTKTEVKNKIKKAPEKYNSIIQDLIEESICLG